MNELRSVDLNLVVLLDALLQESSVTRAAERIGMSTPAMSHALSRLRAQLDDPLLIRAGRGMVLSERAQLLRPRVRTLVEELEGVMSPAAPVRPQDIRRTFRIHATDHVLAVLGPGIDRMAAEEAPGVTLQFLPNVADDAQALREGGIDLAIGVYAGLPPELRIRVLFEDRFVCVVRRDHPEVRSRLSMKRYLALEHVLVAPRGRPGSAVDAKLAERGLQRRVARLVPYFLGALLLVARSDYVLTISERVAQTFREPLSLKVLKPPLPLAPYALQALWHPRSEGDAAHAWLRSVVARAAEAAGHR